VKKKDSGKSLARAVDVLDYFTNVREAGISKISRDLAMSKSTVHYILNTFKSKGFIEQNPDNLRYRLGVKIYHVGMHWTHSENLDGLAPRYVKELSDEIGEIVLLSILMDYQALIIGRSEPSPPFVIIPKIRYTMPLHSTATGKLLLAHSPHDFVEKFFRNSALAPFTANTITAQDKLEKVLKKIVKQGYSLDDDEMLAGVSCCAAPVRDYSGKVIASLSVTYPTEKYRGDAWTTLKDRIIKQAFLISEAMGYRG
jgi:DNA-binding IclR family transcriptional regulator